ncbi:hypothetical protein SAMN05880582_103172 [Rhizobium sp. RU20A]|uniref:hypothetical protein n=1 Tax=Rhizobium sp. RU20A TaxID=1907412 RepID=UPI00095454DF|nr:hypothetical protein [Rhizobium sp. RU20A]SIQ73656.1 hypothetical protein SAMN05880582_103172 [Rhizobium sp. RU20A]
MENALESVRALLNVDRSTAKFLLASQAILAVIGAAIAFKVDPGTLFRYGLVVLLLTVLFVIVAKVFSGTNTRWLIGWGVIILLFLFLIAAVVGGIFNPGTGIVPVAVNPVETATSAANSKEEDRGVVSWLKGIECLVRPLESCTEVQDAIASSETAPVIKPVEEAAATATPPAAAVDKSKYTIYVQFAGYPRETVVKAAQALQAAGWKVVGAAQGGERLAAAAGLSQVRYSGEADKAAAELLASDINQTGIKAGVKATPNPVIVPGVLEVWIGQ